MAEEYVKFQSPYGVRGRSDAKEENRDPQYWWEKFQSPYGVRGRSDKKSPLMRTKCSRVSITLRCKGWVRQVFIFKHVSALFFAVYEQQSDNISMNKILTTALL